MMLTRPSDSIIGNRRPSVQISNTPPPQIESDMDSTRILALLQPLVIPSPNEEDVRTTVWTAILPPEIVFHIIDTEFCGSIDTLQNLALTCRSVRTYVQRYLFRRVDLDTGERRSSPWSNNVIKFLFVIHQHPSLLHYIQILSITLGSFVGSGEMERRITLNTSCLSFIIQQALPNLKDFQLTLYSWVHLSPEFQQSLSGLLKSPKLTRLALLGGGMHAMSPLRFTASSIVDLSISNFLDTSSRSPSSDDSTDEHPLSTQTLTISKIRPTILTLCGPGFDSAVLHAEYCDYSQLATFRFYGGQSRRDFHFINLYLGYFSSTLTSLELYTDNKCGHVGGTTQPNMGSLFRLQHFTVKINISCDDTGEDIRPESAAEFDWLINALHALPTPCLVESICIILYDRLGLSWETLDWGLFDWSVFHIGGKWMSLNKLEILLVSERYEPCSVYGYPFRDKWLPENLTQFRETTGAVLTVKFVTMPSHSAYTTGRDGDVNINKSDPKFRWYYYEWSPHYD